MVEIKDFGFKIKTKDEEIHEVFYNTCEDYNEENYFKSNKEEIDYEFFNVSGLKLA